MGHHHISQITKYEKVFEAMVSKKFQQFCVGGNVATKDFSLKTPRQLIDDLGSLGDFFGINPGSREVMPVGFTTIMMKPRQPFDYAN
jgi:hypothetical protein